MKAGIPPSSCIIVDKKLPQDLASATSLTLEGKNYQHWQDLIRSRKVLHVFVTVGKTHAPPVSFSSVLELWQYLFDLGLLDEGGQVLEIFGKQRGFICGRGITCNRVLRVFRPTCRTSGMMALKVWWNVSKLWILFPSMVTKPRRILLWILFPSMALNVRRNVSKVPRRIE